ncbi:MAG TPA: ATP synthase subunit I [Caulobacteraceae bacterium]|nr:ATP synthase subunit I [Caulobacteraceae bacterium]
MMLWACQLAGFALAGLVVGGASFATLRLNTALYVTGDLWRSLALHLARLSLVGAGLVTAALEGAGPLLAGAGGLVVARWISVRLWGRVA